MIEATRRARSGTLVIAVVAMIGLGVPAIASASISPPAPVEPPALQAPPSQLPTPKPKPTPTPVPTPVPVPTPTPDPTPVPPPPATATPVPVPTALPPPAPPAPTTGPIATLAPPPAPPGGTTPAPVAPTAPADPAATEGGNAETPAGAGPTTPAGSNIPAGPIDASGGRSLISPPPTGGFSGWLVNLAAPIAYLALVLLVAFVIARRRLERRERAELAGAARPPDLDSMPVRRVETRAEPLASDDEENMPRWLRPSLRAERFGMDQTRIRVVPAALQPVPTRRAPLAFGGTSAELSDRRVVRSAAVGLLDQPDAAARHVAELEQGDEVEILETDELWANVLTPTGLAGWLPAVVLAEPVEGAAGSPLEAGDDAGFGAALKVRYAESSVAATPVDEPLDLAAYLAARRHTDTRTGSSGVG